jgi:beta-glucosidase
MATAKHFGAYGAPIGGPRLQLGGCLRAHAAGSLSTAVLCRREGLARVRSWRRSTTSPACRPPPTGDLLRGLLRERWGWQGLMVSDWGRDRRIAQSRASRRTARGAGVLALDASVDMDMIAGVYADDLKAAIAKDKVRLKLLDEAVLRILRVKEQLGLFDNPMQYHDTARETRELGSPEHREAARAIARQSMVLLKNEGNLLPLRPTRSARSP